MKRQQVLRQLAHRSRQAWFVEDRCEAFGFGHVRRILPALERRGVEHRAPKLSIGQRGLIAKGTVLAFCLGNYRFFQKNLERREAATQFAIVRTLYLTSPRQAEFGRIFHG